MSKYLEVDHCKIEVNSIGDPDDDIQIAPSNVVAHGNAGGFVSQGGANCPTVNPGYRDILTIDQGPFCGISGDRINRKPFVLKVWSIENGVARISVAYL